MRVVGNFLQYFLFLLLRPVWLWLRDRHESAVRCDGGEGQFQEKP